jgi:hypothetical protein
MSNKLSGYVRTAFWLVNWCQQTDLRGIAWLTCGCRAILFAVWWGLGVKGRSWGCVWAVHCVWEYCLKDALKNAPNGCWRMGVYFVVIGLGFEVGEVVGYWLTQNEWILRSLLFRYETMMRNWQKWLMSERLVCLRLSFVFSYIGWAVAITTVTW